MIGRRDALMLGTDAGPLKIVTTATRHEEFKESAMRVASYRHATPEQAAAYGEANNVRLTPEDRVIMRRNVVDYYWRVFEGQEEYSCSYTSGIDPEAVHIHSPNAGQSWVYSETGVYPILRLDDYSLLHNMFMQETRTAFAELGYNPS